MAGGSSDVELEPITLNFQQIQFAREAALYILNTKSMEEAFQIFTQGLEPVTSLQGRGLNEAQETETESEEADFDEEECYTNSLFVSHDVSSSPL